MGSRELSSGNPGGRSSTCLRTSLSRMANSGQRSTSGGRKMELEWGCGCGREAGLEEDDRGALHLQNSWKGLGPPCPATSTPGALDKRMEK